MVHPDDLHTDSVYSLSGPYQNGARVQAQFFWPGIRLSTAQFFDGQALGFTYLRTGQRESVTDARGTTWYGYDRRGRMTGISAPQNLWLLYEYDPVGNRTALTTRGSRTTYSYDAADQLTTIQASWGATARYRYNAVGQVDQLTLPDGSVRQYGYDARHRLTDLEQRDAGGALQARYAYTLDAVGNRTGLSELDGTQSSWTYDDANRLVQERVQAPGGQTQTTGYTYDAAGNRLSRTRDGQTTTYRYNALDQLTASSGAEAAQYHYDARGNLTAVEASGQTTSYRYDARDRLVGLSLPGGQSAQYGYDADGRRVREQVGDQITNAQWDPLSGYGDVVLETDGSDTVQAQYLLGNDALLAQWRGGSTASYLLDGQGSVRGLTDASGAVTDRYRYDAFGALTEQQGSTVNPYRFTGQRWDAVSGLYSLRARFYDPGQGRFLSRDTAGLDQSDPVEWNRYGYARNNPTTWSDPSGNMALLGYGIGVIHGARNGALIGAAGGLAYGGFSYIAARIGWCGSPAQAWALEVNPFLYIGQMISVGAAFGAVFGGVAALGPWGSIIAGGTGFVLGGAGVIHALQDIMAHSLNACNAAELTLSLVGMAAGAGQAAGGWKGRGGPNPPEPGPGPGPGKGKGKSPPAEDPPGKAPPAGPPAKDPPGKGSPPGPPAKDPPPGPPAKDPPGKDLPPGPPGKDLPPGPPAGDPPGPPAKDPPGAPGAGGDDGTPPGGPGGDGPKKSPRGPGTGGNPGGVLLVNGPILTEGIVYRRGGFSYKNFTPRPGVDDGINGGLSTYDTLDAVTSEGQRVFEPKDPYQIIDIGRLGKGLIAVRDNDPPGYVKIIPANQLLETLQEWISTRDIGGHPLTQELMNARIGNGRIPKD